MNRIIIWTLISCLSIFFSTNFCNSQITNPRPWAEWEETDGIIIHQPNFYLSENPSPVELLIAEEWDSLYVDLIRGLFDEGVNIYYILDTNDRPEYDSGILDTMQTKYGININSPNFHVIIGCKDDYPNLTKWTRDHGPMNVYKNRIDTLYFFLFRDDYRGAGGVMRDYLNMPDTVFMNAQSGSIASDGGNYMVDGYSMGIINDGEGPFLPQVKDHFGLDTVYAISDYLDHVDYYLKLLNEETLIISAQKRENYIYGTEPYTFEEDSVILSGMVSFFQEQVISQYGRPLKVFQIPNPPSVKDDSLQLWWKTHYASYTNSLIVNKSLFVPQFNFPERDSVALAVYQQALPGYNIIPVFSRRGATAGGAVHCLTNSVASPEPVLIRHSWYYDTVEPAQGYEIIANIITGSGVKNASTHWSVTPEGPFQSISMQSTTDDLYSATIPRGEGVTDLYYYITAESNSGKTGIKPMVAPGYNYHIMIRSGAPGWISHIQKGKGIIKIFPNPATTLVTIDLSESQFIPDNTIRLNLYDQMGRPIIQQGLIQTNGSFQLNVTSLQPGQYFLVLISDNGDFLCDKLLIAEKWSF